MMTLIGILVYTIIAVALGLLIAAAIVGYRNTKRIERNDEEWDALRALEETIITIEWDAFGNPFVAASRIEHELLKRGYAITKVPPINIT